MTSSKSGGSDEWAYARAAPRIVLSLAALEHIREWADHPDLAGMLLSLQNHAVQRWYDPDGILISEEFDGIGLGTYEQDQVPGDARVVVDGIEFVLCFPYHGPEDTIFIDMTGGRLAFATSGPIPE